MGNHPWCSDIARDTAIRAAEDAAASERLPLPDHRELPQIVAEMREHHSEMIAQLFKRVARLDAAVFGVTESRSAAPRTEETSQAIHPAAADGVSPRSSPLPERVTRGEGIGGAQSGLRTERVTLEFRWPVRQQFAPASWKWAKLLSLEADNGESVRVVPSDEADYFDDLAQVAMERDAAIRERDAALARVAELEANRQAILDGSADAEPVADAFGYWNGVKFVGFASVHMGDQPGCETVRLYRAPPPPSWWLTEEEREAIAWFANSNLLIHGEFTLKAISAVRALLSRNSPPRVRLPACPYESYDDGCNPWFDAIEAMQKALAEAGVEVQG